MFDVFFGWRKASKCKKVIKQLQCRLKLLKNKRQAIVRQLREDLAQLIKIGYENVAFDRVEQLIQDESIVAVYELLDNFCEFILINLSYIRRHKECPNDINEAVSSLIFASARCGELPELRVIRKLFGERYGQKFAMAAVELFAGNLVNSQVKEKLSMKSISDDAKQRTVNEIARDYCLRPEILALEYYSDWQQQVKESKKHQVVDTDDVQISEMQTSNLEIERKVRFVNSSSTSQAISSTVEQALPTVSDQEESVANSAEANCENIHDSGTQEERMIPSSSSESLPRLSGELVVYRDDIEESPTAKDDDYQDQRLFRFKSSTLSKRGISKTLIDQSRVDENFGSKRTRKRLVSGENQSMKNIECHSYYDQPCKSTLPHKHKSHQQRKQQKKVIVVENERSRNYRYDARRSCCSCYSYHKRGICSLEHPCYFYIDDDDDDEEDDDNEIPPLEQDNFRSKSFGDQCFCNGEPSEEMEWSSVLKKPGRRSYDNGAMVYDVFTYPDHELNFQNRESKGRVCTGKLPYLRTVTVPHERVKENCKDDMQRSKSFPLRHPNHVHPKLPDCDDITARFLALKKERLQNKLHYSKQRH
ncbi:hypothetical protein UlMin_014392 [Ulmus minor]